MDKTHTTALGKSDGEKHLKD